MKLGKVKPVATIVAQFAAGVEVDAIMHDGRIFMPVVGSAFLSDSALDDGDSEDEKPASPRSEKKPATKKDTPKDSSDKKYTEEELMDMDIKELTKILKGFDVDPNDFDGKNTNKKLRNLILEAQEGNLNDNEDEGDEESEDDSDEKNSSKKEGKLHDKIAGILEDFDSGSRSKKKTVSDILSLTDEKVDEDDIIKVLEDFEEDGDADIDGTADKIEEILSGEKPKKPAGKRGKKDAEKLVDVADLEVGDRVSVWWDDDNQAWYDGEVKSIKRGKVTIAYDDETEDVIDPEVHTKIKRID